MSNKKVFITTICQHSMAANTRYPWDNLHSVPSWQRTPFVHNLLTTETNR